MGSETRTIDRELRPLVTVALICVAAALLVDPRGEFPINDDWSYTRTAFRLASGEGIHVDEWAAPSLVGQALYGAALAGVFGHSFTVLRISTIALSCGFALLLWLTLSRLQVRRELVWIAVLSWIFNPVQFCLSYSFMTEVPFLFLMGLGTYLYVRHLDSGSRMELGWCAAAFGYAFTIRQMAILFIAPLVVCAALPAKGAGWKRSLQNSTLAVIVSSAFIAAYQVFAIHAGGATPATRRKYELLRHITVDQVVGNSFGILFYVSFMLLPLVVAAAPLLWRSMGGHTRMIAAISWTLVAVAGWSWFDWRYGGSGYLPGRAFHSRMPFLLNILWDTGLGPVTLDPTYYGAPETPVHPKIWFAITAATVAGAAGTGMLITSAVTCLSALRRVASPRGRLGLFALLSFLAVALFEVVFSHVQEGGLFDRHIVTAVFPVILAMAAIPTVAGAATRIRAVSAVSVGMLAVLAWFCIAGTHDYLAWNRIRWDLGREMLSTGINPLDVSFGFEFNGWYNYDTFRARGNIGMVYYWWHDREDYLITMAPQEGYRTLKTRTYFSWLHRYSVPLYVLVKADP